SSDVCSSDLATRRDLGQADPVLRIAKRIHIRDADGLTLQIPGGEEVRQPARAMSKRLLASLCELLEQRIGISRFGQGAILGIEDVDQRSLYVHAELRAENAIDVVQPDEQTIACGLLIQMAVAEQRIGADSELETHR